MLWKGAGEGALEAKKQDRKKTSETRERDREGDGWAVYMLNVWRSG